MKPKRASPEVWRVLEFAKADLDRAYAVFGSDERRCERDVVVVFVGHDPAARLAYEELVAGDPGGLPPTMAEDSVMVIATPFAKLLHIARRHYDVGDAEGEFPYEPGTARLAVLVERMFNLQRRRLRLKDAGEYTPDELRGHVGWIVRATAKHIRAVLGYIGPDIRAYMVVAVFHAIDAKAARLCTRMGEIHGREDAVPPPDSLTVRAVSIHRLVKELLLEGYEFDPGELEYLPGFHRVAVFTLGRMFVETVSGMTLEPGGDA